MILFKHLRRAIAFCLITLPSFASSQNADNLEHFIDIKDFITCETGSLLSQFRTKVFPVPSRDQTPVDILQHIPLQFREHFHEQPSQLGPNGTWFYRFSIVDHWHELEISEFRIGKSAIDGKEFIQLVLNEKIDTIRAFLDRDWQKKSAKHEYYKTLDKSNLSISHHSLEPNKTILTCLLLEKN